MTRAWWAAVAVALAVAGWAGMSAAQPQVGQPAPAFTATDAKGQPHALAQYKGKYVVLEWFNNDCPFVKKHYDSGNMQRVQADATGRGAAWLTISSSAEGKQGHLTPEQAEAVVAARGAKQTALLLDGSGAVGQLYGAKTTPHMFIINPEGTLIYAGAIDNQASTDPADVATASNYVQQALNEAMGGKRVSVAETRSYGCSVKY